MAKHSVFGTSVMGPDESAVGTIGNIAEMFNPENQAKGQMAQAHAEYYRQHGEQAAAAKMHLLAQAKAINDQNAAYDVASLVRAGMTPLQAQMFVAARNHYTDAAKGQNAAVGGQMLASGQGDPNTAAALTGLNPNINSAYTVGQGNDIRNQNNANKIAQLTTEGELRNKGNLAVTQSKPVDVAPGHTTVFAPGDVRNPANNPAPSQLFFSPGDTSIPDTTIVPAQIAPSSSPYNIESNGGIVAPNISTQNISDVPFGSAASITPASASAGPSNLFTAPVDPSQVRPMAFNPGQGVREYDPATKGWKEVKAADPKLTVVGNNSRAVDTSGTEIVPATPQATNPRTAINEERLNREAAEAVGKQAGVGVGIRGGKDKKGKTITGMVPTEHADAVGRAARQAYPDLAPSDAVALFIKNQGITFDKEDDQHWYSPNSENSAKIPMVIPRVGGKPFHNPTPVADVAAPAAPAAPAAAAPASIVPDTAPAAPTPAATPAVASPVKVSNEAEYKALPAGTSYLAPDGSVRIKKE